MIYNWYKNSLTKKVPIEAVDKLERRFSEYHIFMRNKTLHKIRNRTSIFFNANKFNE